jgi:hypothetical protein
VALILADGVDDAGEHLAVAGRASMVRSLLVGIAQVLIIVGEVTTGGVVATV